MLENTSVLQLLDHSMKNNREKIGIIRAIPRGLTESFGGFIFLGKYFKYSKNEHVQAESTMMESFHQPD